MGDIAFFGLCGLTGMLPSLLALLLKRPGVASLLALAWFAASVLLLWAIGLGPHGFILFAFMPFWLGNIVALIVALVRYNKERSVT